jgi:hypothetical protein
VTCDFLANGIAIVFVFVFVSCRFVSLLLAAARCCFPESASLETLVEEPAR